MLDLNRMHMLSPFSLALVAGIIALSIFLQFTVLLNNDASVHLSIAYRIWNGESLYTDIWVPNLPFQYYLKMPVIWVYGHFPLSLEVINHFYNSAIAIISYLICTVFLLKSRSLGESNLCGVASVVVAYLIFLFPFSDSNQFSQKEHFIVQFLFIYLCDALLRLEGQETSSWREVLSGGAVVFIAALKPHYMLVFLVGELYFLIRFLSSYRVLSLRHLVVVVGGVAIFLSLLQVFSTPFYRNYFPLYYEFRSEQDLLTEMVFLCLFPLLAALLCRGLRTFQRHKQLCQFFAFLFLQSIALFLCSFVQNKALSYLFMPLESVAIFSITLFLASMVLSSDAAKKLLYSLALLVVLIPLYQKGTSSLEGTKGRSKALHLIDSIPERFSYGTILVYPTVFPAAIYRSLEWSHSMYWFWPFVSYQRLSESNRFQKYFTEDEFNSLVNDTRRVFIDDLARVSPELLIREENKGLEQFLKGDSRYGSFITDYRSCGRLKMNSRRAVIVELLIKRTNPSYRGCKIDQAGGLSLPHEGEISDLTSD